MLSNYYRDIEVYTFTEGGFSSNGSYTLNRTIQALIQAPSNSLRFSAGKAGQTVDGILYCDISESFGQKDKIKDKLSGQMYLLSGYDTQPLGVSGVTPQESQHAEYRLIYDGVLR